jgi:hypothetical protein
MVKRLGGAKWGEVDGGSKRCRVAVEIGESWMKLLVFLFRRNLERNRTMEWKVLDKLLIADLKVCVSLKLRSKGIMEESTLYC